MLKNVLAYVCEALIVLWMLPAAVVVAIAPSETMPLIDGHIALLRAKFAPAPVKKTRKPRTKKVVESLPGPAQA